MRVAVNSFNAVFFASIVVVNWCDFAHELVSIKQACQFFAVNFKVGAVGKIQAIFAANGFGKLCRNFGEFFQGEAHATKHLVALRLVGGIDAELQPGLAIIQVVLDINPAQQTLLDIFEISWKAGCKYGVDDFNAHTRVRLDLAFVLVEPLGKVKHRIVENRFTHARKVQVEAPLS